MDIVRTPDERFVELEGWPYRPNYALVPDGDGGELRVHFVDEGPSDAAPVLLVHGEPSWGYLYRKMIPILADAGHRVIVPDLVGFGRSDKPVAQSDYSYARHVEWMAALIFEHLNLRDITVFGQDWGGLVGLRLVARAPERFARVVAGNTGLPTGDRPPTEAFVAWQRFSQTAERFDVGRVIDSGTVSDLTPEIIAAYDAPFPTDEYKAGARIFPSLVPTSPDDPAAADNRAAWEVFSSFDRPFLCAFSDSDPITAGGDRVFRRLVPGARDQQHVTIEGAGHFLQEDRGVELATVIDEFITATR